MSESVTQKNPMILLGSLALNIFLVAFLLGRMSMHGPHPYDGRGGEYHHAYEDHGPPADRDGGPSASDNGKHKEGMLPPRPPGLFGPQDLFTPEEMKENIAWMDRNFAEMKQVRVAFAEQLKKGGLTQEQVLEHFAQVDKIMETTKKLLHEKAAKKIESLTPEERATFADKILEDKR